MDWSSCDNCIESVETSHTQFPSAASYDDDDNTSVKNEEQKLDHNSTHKPTTSTTVKQLSEPIHNMKSVLASLPTNSEILKVKELGDYKFNDSWGETQSEHSPESSVDSIDIGEKDYVKKIPSFSGDTNMTPKITNSIISSSDKYQVTSNLMSEVSSKRYYDHNDMKDEVVNSFYSRGIHKIESV